MRHFLRPALCLPLLALAACDEIAVADDPAALADLRGQKSCLAAVRSVPAGPGCHGSRLQPVRLGRRGAVDPATMASEHLALLLEFVFGNV